MKNVDFRSLCSLTVKPTFRNVCLNLFQRWCVPIYLQWDWEQSSYITYEALSLQLLANIKIQNNLHTKE